MVMKKCPFCNHELDDKLRICPNCGNFLTNVKNSNNLNSSFSEEFKSDVKNIQKQRQNLNSNQNLNASNFNGNQINPPITGTAHHQNINKNGLNYGNNQTVLPTKGLTDNQNTNYKTDSPNVQNNASLNRGHRIQHNDKNQVGTKIQTPFDTQDILKTGLHLYSSGIVAKRFLSGKKLRLKWENATKIYYIFSTPIGEFLIETKAAVFLINFWFRFMPACIVMLNIAINTTELETAIRQNLDIIIMPIVIIYIILTVSFWFLIKPKLNK